MACCITHPHAGNDGAAMSLKDLISDDVSSVFLNTNDLAETVTYTPVRAASRSIDVVIEEEQTADIREDGTEDLRETIRVYCSRSSTTGISRPKIGDTLTRAAANDPEKRAYSFSGEIESKEPDDWTLVFWRVARTAQGVGE